MRDRLLAVLHRIARDLHEQVSREEFNGLVRSRLCELLNIDVPIVLAPFGPWDQVDLAVEVCRGGWLGQRRHGGAVGP